MENTPYYQELDRLPPNPDLYARLVKEIEDMRREELMTALREVARR